MLKALAQFHTQNYKLSATREWNSGLREFSTWNSILKMVSKWAPLVILIFQKRILGLREVLDQAGPRTWICLSSVLTEPREWAGNKEVGRE